MEYFCDATKCQTVFVKRLQKDPNGDCRYRTVVRNAKKLSVIEAGRLREFKNTEFVWELRKTGVAKAAIKRAAHLLECAEENFHCACALLAVQLFLTYPLTVFLTRPNSCLQGNFFLSELLSKWNYSLLSVTVRDQSPGLLQRYLNYCFLFVYPTSSSVLSYAHACRHTCSDYS